MTITVLWLLTLYRLVCLNFRDCCLRTYTPGWIARLEKNRGQESVSIFRTDSGQQTGQLISLCIGPLSQLNCRKKFWTAEITIVTSETTGNLEQQRLMAIDFYRCRTRLITTHSPKSRELTTSSIESNICFLSSFRHAFIHLSSIQPVCLAVSAKVPSLVHQKYHTIDLKWHGQWKRHFLLFQILFGEYFLTHIFHGQTLHMLFHSQSLQ